MKANDIKKFEKLNKVKLPEDTISETGVVGTILMHPEYMLKVSFIKSKMFYNRELACVYQVVEELYNKGIVEIDNFLITNGIEGNKHYKAVIDEFDDISKDIYGWLEDLKLVARNTLEEYELLANKVITASFKRDSYIKLHNLSNEIITSENDVNEINYKLQQDVSDFSKVYICNQEILTLADQVDKIWEGILGKRNDGFFGFPSKFSELNKYATYEKSELFCLSSPGKTGKSQFLANETWNMLINGVPSLYIDRELSTENHTVRLLSYLTGIDNRKIKTGDTTFAEEKLIKEKLEFIKTLPYVHIYKPVTEMAEMFMLIKSMKLKHGIEFMAYDYVKANDGSDNDRENQKLGRVVDWLKNDIAGSLDLAVITAAQMDDGGNKVADSQKILRNCSTLAYLTRKSMEEIVQDGKDAGNLKLRVKANRNGEIMNDNEYINLQLLGNQCRLQQAQVPFSESIPY